ncbi:MAG: hypothetical protein JWL85_793 [Candidatus Saccharibacteria bacterium]|nr:hypothetical protein [Candidatus Saccharibacteria bacterium]
MSTNKLQSQLARFSLWVFYALLGYMPLHIFLSTWIGTSVGVLEFAKVAKDGVLVVGFLATLGASVTQPWFKQLLRDKLVWLILAYAGLTLLLAAIRPTDQDAEILGIVYNTRFLLFFLYGALLTHLFDARHVLRNAVKVTLSVAVIVLFFGIIQYTLLPNNALTHVGYSRTNGVLPAFFIDDKPDLERAMSTLRDPNSLGSYIIIIGSLALAFLVRTKNRDVRKVATGLFILSLLCLWYTFSRSAWLGFMLSAAVIIAALLAKFKPTLVRYRKQIIVGVVMVMIVGLSSLYALKDSYFVQNVVLHADQSTTLEDPNQLRIRFWSESTQKIEDNPVGGGPGTAGLASIRNQKQGVQLNENYYLQIASEVGIAGLLLFLSILVVVVARLYKLRHSTLALGLFAAFVGLAFTNFLVHIWSNEAVAYTWWGLAGLVLYMRSTK